MGNSSRFKPGESGNPATTFKEGNHHRWPTGVSGNPAGKSRHRARFEEAFNEALITEATPDEAAKLLWASARNNEPWAIQAICQRFAPQQQSLRLVHEVDHDGIDYTKLTNEQLEQLEAIFEQTTVEPPAPEGGDSPAPTA
jgi:hypothetical protein